ncbi:glycosyltransferase [Vibrio alfacsensis]|uniref:glycosyltransferase n=1 Tax=Vibrio alfacsensis TaxID=1074311 RepID=UPI004067CAD1
MNNNLQADRLVTVYITTYNRLQLLKRAINSVINQTYPNIEIIVADDGSTDGTHEYLRKQEENGLLKCLINESESPKGACYGRNNAISIANGYFITGLDDDDYFEPFRIMEFVKTWNVFEMSNYNFSALFDSVIELRNGRSFHCNITKNVSYKMLRRANFVGNQIFTTKQNLVEIGCFDENMPALQDWETWIRLSKKKGDLVNIYKMSYIIDQSHGVNRISEQKAKRIRLAFEKLENAIQPVSFIEKVSHLESMYAYKQINMFFSELILLLAGGKIRRLLQVIKRTFLNAK